MKFILNFEYYELYTKVFSMKKNILLFLTLFVITISQAQILKKQILDSLVILTFDDAPASQYSVVAPLLKQYGFSATFFVCEFPPNYKDSLLYMNWRQMQELYRMGFEVANHTATHAGVSKLSKDQLIAELNYIEDKCDSLGIEKPLNFAYPGYDLSRQALDVLEEQGYKFARAGGSRAYDPMNDHPLLVPSWAMVAGNKSEIMEALKEAKNGKIVVLTIHGVPDLEHPWVNTPPELFEEYLQYLSKHNYKVVALKKLNEYIDVRQAMKIIAPDLTKRLKN